MGHVSSFAEEEFSNLDMAIHCCYEQCCLPILYTTNRKRSADIIVWTSHRLPWCCLTLACWQVIVQHYYTSKHTFVGLGSTISLYDHNFLIGDCALITGSAHSASIVFGSVKTATCELVLVDIKQSRLHRRILPVHNMSRTPVRLCCSTTVDSWTASFVNPYSP